MHQMCRSPIVEMPKKHAITANHIRKLLWLKKRAWTTEKLIWLLKNNYDQEERCGFLHSTIAHRFCKNLLTKGFDNWNMLA